MNFLEISITTSMLIIAIIAIRALFINRIPHRIFNFLWLICGVKLIVPFSLPSKFSIFNFITTSSIGRNQGAINNNPITVNPAPAITSIENIDKVINNPNMQPITEQITPVNYMFVIWVIGFVLACAYFIFSYMKTIKKLSCSIPDSSVDISSTLLKCKLSRKIDVRQSDLIITPLTYGIFKSVIVVPKSMNLDNQEQLEHALLHEVIHIKRFDFLYKLFLVIALCIHWFNPLVWIMLVLANRDIEMSCDEEVLNILGVNKKSSYAYSLIKFEENKLELNPICMFNKNSDKERIKKILKYKKSKIISIVMSVFVIAMVIVACGTGGTSITKDNMYIKPIELTENEKDLLQISKVNENSFFEYSIDDNITEIRLKAIEYTKGVEPKDIGGLALSGLIESDYSGKINFDIDLKTGHSNYIVNGISQELVIERKDAFDTGISYLSDVTQITPNVEIPLMIIREHHKNDDDNNSETSAYLSMDIDYNNVFDNGSSDDFDNVIIVYVIFGTVPVSYDNELTNQGNQLTLEKVMELSKKGEDLTWSDFEGYEHNDIGSGFYILDYNVEDKYILKIHGDSPDKTPNYIRLEGQGLFIDDIRYTDLYEIFNQLSQDLILKIENALEQIMSSPKTSSSPYDYINENRETYESLIKNSDDQVLDYLLNELKTAEHDGLREQIIKIISAELLGDANNVENYDKLLPSEFIKQLNPHEIITPPVFKLETDDKVEQMVYDALSTQNLPVDNLIYIPAPIIFDSFEYEGEYKILALTYGIGYSLIDDRLIETTGYNIPMAIIYDIESAGNYTFKKIINAQDGSDHLSSVEEFCYPKTNLARDMINTQKYIDEQQVLMLENIRLYNQANNLGIKYIESINSSEQTLLN